MGDWEVQSHWWDSNISNLGRQQSMKHARLTIQLLVLITLCLSQGAWAEGDKAADGKLKGWHAHYAKELQMTDEQIEQYKAILKTRYETESKWKAENKEAYESAKKAMNDAKASGDKEAYSKAKADYYAVKKSKDEANKAYETALDGLLTAEQQGRKTGLSLYNSVKWYIKKADVSSEQQNQIKEMAIAEGAKLVDAKGKEYHNAKMAFVEKVKTEVLTDAQRTAIGSKDKTPKIKKDKPAKK